MRTRPLEKKNWLCSLFICLALVSILVAAMCGLKVYTFERIIEENNHHHLADIAQRNGALVDQQIAEVFTALDTTASEYVRHPGGQEDHYLSTVAREYGLYELSVFSPEDAAKNSDPGYAQALAEGLAGNHGLAPAPTEENMETMVFSVPVRMGSRQTGVLVAELRRSKILDGLKLESFEGEGASWIIGPDGTVLFTDGSKNAPACGENSLDIARDKAREGQVREDIIAAMQAGRSGRLDYSLKDGTKKILAFVPLQEQGWYLLSNVSAAAAGHDMARFIHTGVAVDLINVAIFVLAAIAVGVLFLRKQRHLEVTGTIDSVTGGPSRDYFTKKAQSLIRAAKPGTYALVSADIQNFKLINDTFGSEKGDLTLRYIYRTVAADLKSGEAVARISADTFSLLMKNAPHQELQARLAGLVQSINSFNDQLERKYFLTIFQGVYVIHDPSMDFIAIQDRANVARKNNKHNKNERGSACTFYSEVDRTRLLREKDIDNRMGTALENGEFVMYLQPKVELRWDTVAGAEALARWQDPERGLIMPGEFIPIFERNGFVVQLDLFIFEQVCRLIRRWIDEGKHPIPISVNLSRIHLNDPNFLDAYRDLKEQYRIPAGLIEIELTETLVYENLDILNDVIRKIHDLDFRCSLDDFGSGFSSLNMLKEVPTDALKIDRAFFTGMERSSRGEHVVASIIGLARRLKMETICEGIERADQMEFLRRTGCDMVQGYVFSPPLPVEEFETLAFSGRSIVIPGDTTV
ncbi:MAG: EAL domain-containing protein [Pseudoflavonifractor sp.]